MAIRKVYAPYSTTGEQVGQTPVEGYVDVKQEITPILLTGELGKDGEWSGVTVTDKTFTIDAEHPAIPNGVAVLSPQTANANFIDMTGFKNLLIAIKPTNTGNYKLQAVMGTAERPFANLQPVNAATVLRGWVREGAGEMDDLATDAAEALVADVWNIYCVCIPTLANQKNLQWKITNNSGGNSDIQFAYMRVV